MPESLRSRLAFEALSDDVPLGDAVFRALRQALRTGAFRPGDRLREEEIARALKVSRTPVREAFGRLLAKGLVQPAGTKGLIVRSLDLAEVLELYTMREILEGAAARLAAQHISAPETAALSDLDAAFEKCAADATEMARLNRLFHDAIVRAARNRYLQNALEELQDGIALLGDTTFSVPGRQGRAAEEHRTVLEAIRLHDADLAETRARAHIREALRARMNFVQRIPEGGLVPIGKG